MLIGTVDMDTMGDLFLLLFSPFALKKIILTRSNSNFITIKRDLGKSQMEKELSSMNQRKNPLE